MKRNIILAAAVFLTGGLLCAQTLDEVLDMYYRAHGGLGKLKALTAMKMAGKIVIPGQGLEMPMTRWQKAPDKMRVETVIQGRKIIQGFDGRTVWWLNPFLKAEAEEMVGEQGKLFREQAVFENPLVVFKEKGYRLELLGREKMDGVPVFKLKLVKSDDREIFFFLDAASGIGLKSSLAVKTGETVSLVEIIYGDYRLVDGRLVPFIIENRTDGKTEARLVLETVVINPGINDSKFSSPPKKEAAKGAVGKKKK